MVLLQYYSNYEECGAGGLEDGIRKKLKAQLPDLPRQKFAGSNNTDHWFRLGLETFERLLAKVRADPTSGQAKDSFLRLTYCLTSRLFNLAFLGEEYSNFVKASIHIQIDQMENLVSYWEAKIWLGSAIVVTLGQFPSDWRFYPRSRYPEGE